MVLDFYLVRKKLYGVFIAPYHVKLSERAEILVFCGKNRFGLLIWKH